MQVGWRLAGNVFERQFAQWPEVPDCEFHSIAKERYADGRLRPQPNRPACSPRAMPHQKHLPGNAIAGFLQIVGLLTMRTNTTAGPQVWYRPGDPEFGARVISSQSRSRMERLSSVTGLMTSPRSLPRRTTSALPRVKFWMGKRYNVSVLGKMGIGQARLSILPNGNSFRLQ
jgi:hypothetical protein